jgi:hypothetical protein
MMVLQILSFIKNASMEIMYTIESSKKMENGIVVFYIQKGEKKFESFNYQELIDRKINAFDLLEHPHRYRVDSEFHNLTTNEV